LIDRYGDNCTTLYFSDKYKIDLKAIRKDAPSFLRYFRECQSVPLKIIMSGGGAAHKLILEAVEITEKPLNMDVFNLPN
jgi:hypothetical protein